MAFARRIFFFMLVNVAVMVTLTTVAHLLGVRPYLNAYGLDYEALAIFCLVWGMGGAIISLLISRMMAKWTMGVQVIEPNTADPELRRLVATVHQLAAQAGLSVMPEVGIYDSPEVNAFATGPTRNRSLVAVSSGLLHRMRSNEVTGVLGHEVAHIANGDMVTMTLVQGVVNAFVMFLARVIAFAIAQGTRRSDDERGASPMMQYFLVQVLEILFMFLGMFVIAGFSRYREYRADKGGADLAGRANMIAALEGLRRTFEMVDPGAQPAVQTLKISTRPAGIFRLLSTHPPLEERIERLKNMQFSAV
jgi:heat shock protein HtpX